MRYFFLIISILLVFPFNAVARCVDISGKYLMEGASGNYEIEFQQNRCASVKLIHKFYDGVTYDKTYSADGIWRDDREVGYSQRFYLTGNAFVYEIKADCNGTKRINQAEYVLQNNGDLEFVSHDWDWSCSHLVSFSKTIKRISK